MEGVAIDGLDSIDSKQRIFSPLYS